MKKTVKQILNYFPSVRNALKKAIRPLRSKRYTKYDGKNDIHWQWYALGNHWYEIMVDETMSHFTNKGSVLDMGSGDGLVDHLFIKKGFEVLGVEPEKDGVAIAREKVPEARFEQNTLENFSPSRRFDYLYSLNTIEHVKNPKEYIRLMESIDKFAIITTDNGSLKHEPGAFDRQLFTKESLRNLFSTFKTEDLKLSNPEMIGIKVYAK